MFIKLRRGESVQTFNIWVYGEQSLMRGSGIYVGTEGVTCNHHFLLPDDGTKYEFLAGDYILEVYVSLVGDKQPLLLAKLHLVLTESQSGALKDQDTGIYFDWGPDSGRYHAVVKEHPKSKRGDLADVIIRQTE